MQTVKEWVSYGKKVIVNLKHVVQTYSPLMGVHEARLDRACETSVSLDEVRPQSGFEHEALVNGKTLII